MRLRFDVLSFACLAGTLLAQEGSGRLGGAVTDSSDAAVPGVVISVVHRATALTRQVTSDTSGNYQITALPIGLYDITASHGGLATLHSKGVTIAVGTTTRLDLKMQIATVSQEVTVQAAAAVLNTESAEGGVLLSGTQVTSLPLNGRNFLHLVSLQPGVRPNAGAGRESFTMNGAPPQQGINLLVDGTDATGIESAEVGGINRAPGQSTFTLGLDSISEFVVHTNNYSVRYGKSLGGVIEAVTKSGSNELHGNVFHFFRNNTLNANTIQGNAAGLPRAPQRFNQFGGNAGGPLVRNKMFFWGGFEGVRRRTGATNSFTVFSDEGRARIADPAIAKYVNDYIPRANRPPTANPLIALLVRNDVEAVREDIATARYDYRVSTRDTFFARYNLHDASGTTPGLGTPNHNRLATPRQQLGTISLTHTLGPTATLNLRAGVNRLVNHSRTTGPDPGINVAGIVSVSGGFLNQDAIAYTYAGDYNWVRGAHSFSAGFEYHTTTINRTQRGAASYSYLAGANQLENFFRNIPDQFSSASVIGGNSGRSGSLSLYFEDAIKVSRTLTLNAGLRHDYFFRPTEKFGRIVGIVGSPFPIANLKFTKPGDQVIPRDFNGYGPRIGLAWSPNRKFVARAGYGLFVGLNYPALPTAAAFTMVPPIVPQEQYDPDYAQTSIVFTRADRPDLFYPNVSFVTKQALLSKAPPPSPNFPRPDWKNTYTHQWSLRLEGELMPETRFSVGYVGTKAVKVIGESRHNLIRPLMGNTRENPAFNNITLRGSFNNSNYQSLQLQLSRRLHRRVQFNAYYTWSHSIDDIFGFADLNNPGVTPQTTDLKMHRASSAFDVRHDVKLDYYYELPTAGFLPPLLGQGWTVGGITRIDSGTPFTVLTGTNVGDAASPQRPNILCADARSGTSPGLFQQVLTPTCFERPAARDPLTGFMVGNLGRNTFYGPATVNFDFNIAKNTRIGERFTHQLRGEFFNVFNNTNFTAPVNQLSNPNFGRILGASAGRQIQLAMKLIF
jgi:hypothetical protein